MDDSVKPLFDVPSCAVFGRRRATSKPLPDTVRAYSGSLPLRDASEALVDRLIAAGEFKVTENAPKPAEALSSGGSVYREAFRNGATLFPRMLCFIERKTLGRLGADPTAPLVASYRGGQEKRPWKLLPSIENQVEAEFLRPTLLGESILPYRVFRPFEAVIPVDENGGMLNASTALDRGFDRLAGWMRKAETVWNENQKFRKISVDRAARLLHNELSLQFPLGPFRVAYAASGTQPAAVILRDSSAVIEHKLYWASPDTVGEAQLSRGHLSIAKRLGAHCRLIGPAANGEHATLTKPSSTSPFPAYDAKLKLHRDLAAAAERPKRVAAAVALARRRQVPARADDGAQRPRRGGPFAADRRLVAKLLDRG